MNSIACHLQSVLLNLLEGINQVNNFPTERWAVQGFDFLVSPDHILLLHIFNIFAIALKTRKFI